MADEGAENQKATRAFSCESPGFDWLRNRRIAWLWPVAFAVAIGGWLLASGVAGALLAAAGFAAAGVLCVANAVHCRRVHCTVTGPLYLAAALLFVARAAGWGIAGGWIIAGAVAGTTIAFVPEWLGKLYFGSPGRGSGKGASRPLPS